MTKKPTPVAVCTRCGHATDNLSLINKSCPIKYIKRGKCKGIYQSMLAPGDWEECEHCSATGFINDNDCEYCKGTGWINTRKNY